MALLPRFQREPEWCVQHCVPAPCLFCLSPQVADILIEYHKKDDKPLDCLFCDPDMNNN